MASRDARTAEVAERIFLMEDGRRRGRERGG